MQSSNDSSYSNIPVKWSLINNIGDMTVTSGGSKAEFEATTVGVGYIQIEDNGVQKRITLNVSAKIYGSIEYAIPTYLTSGFLITPITPSVVGNVESSFTITPAMSNGLNFNTTSGVISGTPAQYSAGIYEISAIIEGETVRTEVEILTGDILNVDPAAGNTSDDVFPGDGICLDGSGNCSLRAAITEASGLEAIILIPDGTYTISSGIQMSKGMALIGNSQNNVIINSDGANHLFLYFFHSNLITLKNMTIQNFVNNSQFGGAISVGNVISSRKLSIENVTFLNNRNTSNFGRGGAINFLGEFLSVKNSKFINNDTTTGGTSFRGGGALYWRGTGGSKKFILKDTLFENNRSGFNSGGNAVYLTFGANVEISGNTFKNNFNAGLVSPHISLLIENTATGIVKNNTFVATIADRTEGIYSNGMTDFEFIHNTFSRDDTTASRSLLSGFGSTVTIFFGNIMSNKGIGSGANCSVLAPGFPQGITSQGYNLSTDSSCLLNGNDLVVGDMFAGPTDLANNGGPTETIALQSGSIALDTIPSEDCQLKKDQRGEERNESCDTGAFELQ
jgi:hypothetical protein